MTQNTLPMGEFPIEVTADDLAYELPDDGEFAPDAEPEVEPGLYVVEFVPMDNGKETTRLEEIIEYAHAINARCPYGPLYALRREQHRLPDSHRFGGELIAAGAIVQCTEKSHWPGLRYLPYLGPVDASYPVYGGRLFVPDIRWGINWCGIAVAWCKHVILLRIRRVS